MSNHNQSQIKDALMAMLDHYKLRDKYRRARLKALWPELMGTAIAGYTTELRIHQRTIFITLNSAPLRQELTMGREKIRQLLNEALGEEYIQEVVIR